VEYVWNGPLATDWQGIRGPYLGSAENPFPNAAARDAAYPSGGRHVGERIAMANPAIVPRGWGWLEWSGSIWFVPAGEPIAQQWGMDNAYLADQTPGALVLTKIFQSPIIPDAFLPIKQKYELAIFAMVINASGVVGCRMGACISGGDPTSPLTSMDYNYTAATGFTPTSNGVGFLEQNARYPGGRSSAGPLLHSKGGTGRILRNGAVPNFVSENNRFYLMGQPSHIADRFVFEGGYSITSLGVAA
jgi:hypothetical protein